jgi:hypothetical protein
MVDNSHLRPLTPLAALALSLAAAVLLAVVVGVSFFAGALACWPPEGTDIAVDGLRNWSCDHLMGPLAGVAFIAPIVLLVFGGTLSATRRTARPLLIAFGLGLLCAAAPLVTAALLPDWTTL